MYCTKTDILKRIKKAQYDALTAPDAEGITEENILNEAIAGADSTIDGYLKKVTKVLPMASPPKSITDCSCTIAIFNLHARIQYDQIPEFWKDKYDAAIAFLRDVSKGMADLSVEIEETNRVTMIKAHGSGRVFGRDK